MNVTVIIIGVKVATVLSDVELIKCITVLHCGLHWSMSPLQLTLHYNKAPAWSIIKRPLKTDKTESAPKEDKYILSLPQTRNYNSQQPPVLRP